MPEDRFAGDRDRPADREQEHAKRNEEQGELVRHAVEQLRERRDRQRRTLDANGGNEPWDPIENDRRLMDRRAGGRGGQRRSDRGLPWWQKGLAFALLCAILRCWRFFRPRNRR